MIVFVSFFILLCAVGHQIEGRMQDKTRMKHRYLEEFCKLRQRRLCEINMNCDTRRRTHVHFFGKTKSWRENKMKVAGEQDTGFVPRQILIWRRWSGGRVLNRQNQSDQICSRNSAAEQQVLVWPPCAKCTACAKCSELGAQIRGWCTFSRLRLTGEFCLRIRIRWRSMVRCTFSRALIFAGTPAASTVDVQCNYYQK